MNKSNEVGLYIHIPFCKSKCNYCDFNSYDDKECLTEQYIDCLIKEIGFYSRDLKNKIIESIFIGGGTPSLINEKCISDIICSVNNCFLVGDDIEISIEANPGTLSENKLKKYFEIGINRLSMGLQSWNEIELKLLGRIHTARELIDNYIKAREIGFTNINFDIMFGIPNQTIESFKNTLKNIISLNPEHISCYSLKLEDNTPLKEKVSSGIIEELSEDMDREMYHLAVNEFINAGYEHYEISNFSKPGFACKHNMVYWNTNEYLGLGLGAHSFLNSIRFENEVNLEEYIKKIENNSKPIVESRKNLKTDDISEYMFLGLRLIKGIDYIDFYKKFGVTVESLYKNQIDMLIKKELLLKSSEGIRLTDKGLDLANLVFMEFV